MKQLTLFCVFTFWSGATRFGEDETVENGFMRAGSLEHPAEAVC